MARGHRGEESLVVEPLWLPLVEQLFRAQEESLIHAGGLAGTVEWAVKEERVGGRPPRAYVGHHE